MWRTLTDPNKKKLKIENSLKIKTEKFIEEKIQMTNIKDGHDHY